MRKRWVYAALPFVFLLNVLIHISPLLRFEIWGSDSGEYYALSRLFLSGGDFTYYGWGIAYREFPAMFYFIDMFSALSGVGVYPVLRTLVPLTAALSSVFVFLFAREVTHSDEASILGAIFFVLAFPHAYAASHTMAGAFADPLFTAALFLYARHLNLPDRRLIWITLLITVMTACVHHLTAFVLGATMLLTALERALLLAGKREAMVEYAIGATALASSAVYWSTTDRFMNDIVVKGSGLPYWLFFITLVVGLAIYYAVLRLLFSRSGDGFLSGQKDFNSRKKRIVAALVVIISAIIWIAAVGLPGTTVRLPLESAILVIPFLVVVSFAALGPSYIDTYRSGHVPLFMTLSMVFLYFVASLLLPTVIIPYRIGQYIMAMLAPLVGAGVYFFGVELSTIRPRASGYYYAAAITVLLLVSASSIPPKEFMGGFQEGTTWDEMTAVMWLRTGTGDNATIASDHRMSSMAFGFAGRNATWDYAYYTMHGNESEAMEEACGVHTPSGKKPIDYVLLTEDIRRGVALLQWEPAEAMKGEAAEKFNGDSYIKLYSSSETDVYWVAGR